MLVTCLRQPYLAAWLFDFMLRLSSRRLCLILSVITPIANGHVKTAA